MLFLRSLARAIAVSASHIAICFAAPPPQTITPSEGSFNFPEANTILNGLDPRFMIRPIYWGPKLDSIVSLQNAVNAMANMALRNTEEGMRDTTFKLDGSPNNAITVFPNRWQVGGQITRKFVIWGLLRAVYDMTSKNKYQCNTCHLLWQGVEVGTLGFSRGVIAASQTSAGDYQSRGLLSLDNDTALGPSSLQTQSSPVNVNHTPVLSVDVEPRPLVLQINDVFMTILGAMGNLAAYPNKDESIYHFHSDWPGTPAFVSFSTRELKPRSKPPFMTCRYIVESLAVLPSIMLNRRKFSEVDIVLKLDGVEAGVGLLRRLHRPGLDQGTPNVTVA